MHKVPQEIQIAPGSYPRVTKRFLRQFRHPNFRIDLIAEWNNFNQDCSRNDKPYSDHDVIGRFSGWLKTGMEKNLLELLPRDHHGSSFPDDLDDVTKQVFTSTPDTVNDQPSGYEPSADAVAGYCWACYLSDMAERGYRHSTSEGQSLGDVLKNMLGSNSKN